MRWCWDKYLAENFIRGRQIVGKVIVIDKHFVINMIMIITMFAQCSNRGSANYFLLKYFR